MYEARTCSKCDTLIYYPDEVVAGFWVSDRGVRVDSDHPKNIFIVVNEDNAAEATSFYCLDCAPCECGEHEKFVAHTAQNILRSVRV